MYRRECVGCTPKVFTRYTKECGAHQQVLPQAKEADHTQAIEGEAMQANSDNTQLRIMHIM